MDFRAFRLPENVNLAMMLVKSACIKWRTYFILKLKNILKSPYISCFLEYLLRILEKSECFLAHLVRIREKSVVIPNYEEFERKDQILRVSRWIEESWKTVFVETNDFVKFQLYTLTFDQQIPLISYFKTVSFIRSMCVSLKLSLVTLNHEPNLKLWNWWLTGK